MYTTEIIQILTWPALIIIAYQVIKFTLKLVEKKTAHSKALGIVELFGTHDFDQITGSVKAMYIELEGLRTAAPKETAVDITKLTSEIEKAQAVSARWEAKAISSTQEVAELRQEIKEHGKWRPLSEEQLAAFLPTVTIKDGESENAFLDSKRRQRRLTQRLSAEVWLRPN